MVSIVKRTKNFSPKYVRKEHPESFRTKLEEERYWGVEFDKWIDGVKLTNDEDGEVLTGKHYFHLQEIMIPTLDGGMIRPWWRDVDDEIFGAVEHCERTKDDLLVGKRRGLGLTSIFGCTLPLYYALTVPNTVVPITSADKTRVEAIMSFNLMPAYSNLNPYYKEEMAKKNKSEIYLAKSINKTIIKDGQKRKVRKEEGMMSKIVAKQTHTNPTNFEGIRALYGFLDELFLHPFANRVRASMRQCFGAGLQKKGWLAMGGSAGDENPESLKVAESLWLNSKDLNLVTIFIPGTRGNDGVCSYTGRQFSINGWSQDQVALEYIEKELDRLAKSTDLTEYRNFKHAMPLTVEDMFAIKKSDVFPPEVMDILNLQRKKILVTQPPIHVGEIEEKSNGEIRFTNDRDNGKTKILRMPSDQDKNVKYLCVAGTDPIPGNNANAEGSNQGFVLMDRPTKTPLAIREERSADVPGITRQNILCQKFFHNTETMVELNQGTLVLQTYKDEGVYNTLLADRPSNLDIKFQEKKTRKGFSKTGPMGVRLHQCLTQHILEHGGNIWFLDLIDDLLKYSRGENADLTDAFAAAILTDADWSRREIKETKKTKIHQVATVQKVNGKYVQVYVEIRK